MASGAARKPGYGRRLTWLGAVLALLIGGYSAAWFYAASRIEGFATAAIAGLNRDGIAADCANAAAGGFPFGIALHCDALRYANAGQHVDASVAAFRAGAQVYDPFQIVAELDGPARISAAGGALHVDWRTLRASVRLAMDFPERFSAEIADLSAAADSGTGATTSLATIGHGEAHLQRSGDDLDLAGSFTDARIDRTLLRGADLPPIEGAADLTIKDGIAMLRLGDGLHGRSGTIRTLSISSGKTAGLLLAGPFSVSGDGLLDADLTVTIRDPKALSALLAKAFPAAAAQIAASLSGLAALGANPSLPLRIAAGRATLGFIPLGEIPPL